MLPNTLPTARTHVFTMSPAGATLRDFQRSLILDALEAVGWVIGGPKGAAARLGLPRTSLIAKMEKLGISRQRKPWLEDKSNFSAFV